MNSLNRDAVSSQESRAMFCIVHTHVASGAAGKKVFWKSDVPAVFITWYY